MASTYSTNLAIELIGTGEQSGTWGTTTNTNLGTLIEQSISGYVTQAITDGSGANTTITIPNGATGVARNMVIEMTGALSFSTTSLIVPANKKLYFIFNNTSGGFAVTVKVSGQTGVLVPNGKKVILTSNGTDIVEAANQVVGAFGVGGTATMAAINASGLVAMAGAATVGTTLGVTGTSTMAAINASGVLGITTNNIYMTQKDSGGTQRAIMGLGNDNNLYIGDLASFSGGIKFGANGLYAMTLSSAGNVSMTGTLGVTGAAAFGGAVSTVAQTKLTGSWTGSGDAFGLEINHALTATSTNNILGVYVHQTMATGSVNHSYIDGVAIDAPVISGTGTVTYANTLRIGGAPTISGGGTITNAKALWVTSGATQLDGTLGVTGTSTMAAINASGVLGITTNNIYMTQKDSGGTQRAIMGLGNDNNLYIGDLASFSGGIKFGANGLYAMTLSSAGNVSMTGTLGVTGTTNILGSSGAELSSGALNVFGATGNGVIYTRHTGTAGGKYWSTGADAGNNFVVFNQGAVGMYMTDGGTSWTATSDERMKDIIEPITGAIFNIAQLRSVIGKYKTDAEGVRRPFLIAQDVQKVLPEAVIERDGILGMSYTDVVPLLVAAIKELAADFQAYKSSHP